MLAATELVNAVASLEGTFVDDVLDIWLSIFDILLCTLPSGLADRFRPVEVTGDCGFDD